MIYQLNEHYFARSLELSDIDGPYFSWFEDQEVCKFNSHGKFFKTKEYFRSLINTLDREDQVTWALCHNQDGHVGNICLQAISFVNRNAEFAVIIGDRRHWRSGLGKLAGAQLIRHGFYKLNLERIYCGTASTNIGMQNLALSLGFQEEGRRRAHLYLEGAWVDMVEYGVLRADIEQLLLP
jgi:ribosomal-protein-alanine N-acetyltransferase